MVTHRCTASAHASISTMKNHAITWLGLAVLCSPSLVQAHVSIASGPAVAAQTQVVTFQVGHGCEGADTSGIIVEIPEGVTSVRPSTSDFGQVDVETDA